VTPASGFVEPMEAMAIGAIAGGLCYLAVRVRSRIGFDDSLDVVGVHGVGGMWGAIGTGLFASAGVSGLSYAEGVFSGEWNRLTDALIGIGAIGAYSLIVTFILLKVIDVTIGIRVSEDEEELGLDVTQHGERAYTGEDSGSAQVPGSILPAPPMTYAAGVQAVPAKGHTT